MKRLASLYLPQLAIERLRRPEPAERPKAPPLDGEGLGWGGVSGNAPHFIDSTPTLPSPIKGEGKGLTCSCPNTPGWRPGARWAREEGVGGRAESHTRSVRAKSRTGPERSRGSESERSLGFARHGISTSLDANGFDASPPQPLLPTPLVTAHRTGNRQLVAAASAEARALGLAPGMPLSQARALVPGLEVADADPEGDSAFLHRLALFAARRWTPRAALTPPDGLFLDLTGASHLFGGERKACVHFVHFIARLGFTARIAVAGTWGAAHALARFSDEAVTLCPNGGEAEALAPLPLAALRLSEDALGAARRLGLETVGELIAMPRAPLQRRFGRTFVERLDQALGRASEAVDPIVPEEAPAAELRFAEPIGSAEAIAEALTRLVSGLTGTLAKRGLGARRVALLCLRVDGAGQELAIGTARATRDATHLQRLLLPRIEEIDPGFGIEAMRLVAVRAEPLGPEQPSLRGAQRRGNPAGVGGKAGVGRCELPPAVRSRAGGTAGLPTLRSARNDEEADLSLLVDRLAGRLGARRLFRVGAIESDVPERGVRRLPPFAQPAEWPQWPRPVRMLSPPERVENVVALLPDQPPRRFTWRGRAYQVRAADGPERIHGEWWRARAEAHAVRDYFQVEDEEGARFWLFRRGNGTDPRTGDLSWYLHGMFG